MKAKIKIRKTLSDLIADDNNANKGTARDHEVVQESLKQFGAGRSILVDKVGRVIAGNKTSREIDVDAMEMSCTCPKCGFQFDPK